MAIPGLRPQLPVRAKVRIGVKRVSAKGTPYPASVDYFVCPDAAFVELVGERAQTLRIVFPFADAEDNFNSGLEWWRGRQLACYTKGDGKALRVRQALEDDEILDERQGKERAQIVCRARTCPVFKRGDCKPMGRLLFFLENGPRDAVYQIDTHSWNSIERIEGALGGFAARGDLRARVFELRVQIVEKGRDKFPVLSIHDTEAAVPIKTPEDVEKAEALVAIHRGQAQGVEPREILAEVLDLIRPNWRDDKRYVARIKEVGVPGALAALDKRVTEELG